jgi:DtxR family Mn-dependent transcriptional regulator
MFSQAIQDYIKAIYKLQANGPVQTNDIAKEIGVSGASVTGMLKRLDSMKLVEYNSYKGVVLSESGNKVALEIVRFHRLLETYLREMLNYPLDRIHEEACRLEHFISEEFIEKITVQLGDPKFDPHGHPIPGRDGSIPDIPEISLSTLEPGTGYVISRLNDMDPKLLAYLESNGLMPGTTLEILEKEPFNGPLKLSYKSREKMIGYEVASNIFIHLPEVTE